MELKDQDKTRVAPQLKLQDSIPSKAFKSNVQDNGQDTNEPHDKSQLMGQQNGDCQQTDSCNRKNTFEDIFHYIGHRGRFQILLVTIILIANVNGSMMNMNTVFTLVVPSHRCKLPTLNHDTYAIKEDRQAELVDRYIPKTKDGGYEKCHLLSGVNVTGSLATGSEQGDAENRTSCTEWVYDKTVMKRTLVSKLDLVCEKTVVRSHGNMVLFGGKMAAGFVQGYLSDLIGRRPCLILSCIGMFAGSIGSVFVFNPMTLLVSRFVAGFFATATYLSVYVLGIEFLTIKQRSLLSQSLRITAASSDVYMALMAYLLRDWQYLLLAIAWPSVCAVAMCWFLPESPRWLISNDRLHEAEKVVARVGKINGRQVPKGILRQQNQADDTTRKYSVIQLFVNCRLTVRWTILYFNWIAICMSTYGLAFNISNMGGNVYLNFAISGILDASVSTFNSFLVNRISRKYFYFTYSMFGACVCILTFLPILLNAPSWCIVALSLVGKAALISAYPLIYTYSAELFPTTHRGIGVGSCSMMSRIGGLISPYVADLGLFMGGQMASVLPQLVFGTCSIIASLLILTLPETREGELPATVDDIIRKPQKETEPTSTENV